MPLANANVSVLAKVELLIDKLQTVFDRNGLSLNCIVFRGSDDRQQCQACPSRAVSQKPCTLCRRMLQEDRHPLLSAPGRRLSPVDMLDSKIEMGDDPDAARLLRGYRSEGLASFYSIPFRDSAGTPFYVNAAGRDREVSEDEAKIAQSDGYAAIGALEDELAASRKRVGVLSGRERECLIYAAYGLTERETAERMSISHNTVHAHLENARRRLGAPNKLALLMKCLKRGEIATADIDME